MSAGNLAGFDANEVPPQDSFDPFAAGWKVSAITDSEFKETKNGKGHYLQLEWTVLEGEDEGRKAWSNLNLDNPNPTAVEIAQRELSAICRAIGVMAPNDSSELHDRPMLVKWAVKPGKDGYEPRNEPKAYKPVDSDAPTPPSTASRRPAPRAAATPSSAKTPPWKKS